MYSSKVSSESKWRQRTKRSKGEGEGRDGGGVGVKKKKISSSEFAVLLRNCVTRAGNGTFLGLESVYGNSFTPVPNILCVLKSTAC